MQVSDDFSAKGLPIVPVFIGVAVGYLILTVPLGLFIDRVERRQAVAR
jgi:glutamate transport system permease protein